MYPESLFQFRGIQSLAFHAVWFSTFHSMYKDILFMPVIVCNIGGVRNGKTAKWEIARLFKNDGRVLTGVQKHGSQYSLQYKVELHKG